MQSIAPLTEDDFNNQAKEPVSKLEIYTDEWKNLCDLDGENYLVGATYSKGQKELSYKPISATINAVIDDTDGNFHPENPDGSYNTYIKTGRKIKFSTGFKKDGTDYTWQWFEGVISDISRDNTNRQITLTGFDYSQYLTEVGLKSPNNYWKANVTKSITADQVSYSLPAPCNGVYIAYLDDSAIYEGEHWVYNKVDNKIYFLPDHVPAADGVDNFKIYYFTEQVPENVIADILVVAGLYDDRDAALLDMDYTATGITLDRVWFYSGIKCLSAIEKICERCDYQFYFKYNNKPVFKPFFSALERREDRVFAFTKDLINEPDYQENIDEVRNNIIVDGERYSESDLYYKTVSGENLLPESVVLTKIESAALDQVIVGKGVGEAPEWSPAPGVALLKDITSYADSPMIVTGAALSNGTNAGTLKVGILTALLREAASDIAALEKVSLAEQDNIAIPDPPDTFYHIVLTSIPSIVIQVARANGTTEIGIGSVMREADNTVHFAEAGMRLQNGVAKLHRRAAALRYIELASGCVITETGGALTLGISAGIAYEGISRFTPFSGGAFDSNVADSFTRVYRDGVGGFTKLATQSVIDSDNYDDNSGGVVPITANQYSVHWVYLHPDDEHVYVVYGRDSYKLAEALTEQPYGDLPVYVSEFGVLLGKIITKKGTAIFDDVQMVTDTFFVGTAATIHGNLGGLDVVGDHNWSPTKTTAAWNKSIGAAGDYATWADMIADMPDLIAHAVTVTIKTGTTLTETCNLRNKHGLTVDAAITIKAEEYFPQAGAIPTATGATATTLVDAGQAWAIDRFIDCWVFVVDGTGTDNGFVKITDSDATSVTVAAWPGTQPDNTSRYLIVGALIDGGGVIAFPFLLENSSINTSFHGIGVKDSSSRGMEFRSCQDINVEYCGIHGSNVGAISCLTVEMFSFKYGGIVGNNTDNHASWAGLRITRTDRFIITDSGINDNNQKGILVEEGSYLYSVNNFGDLNGNWGTYARYSAQARMIGTECSGVAGNHSDPGTAGNASADQAAAY